MTKPLTPSIRCPECLCGEARQLDSRMDRTGKSIRRRYECANRHRFTTYEREPQPVIDYQI